MGALSCTGPSSGAEKFWACNQHRCHKRAHLFVPASSYFPFYGALCVTESRCAYVVCLMSTFWMTNAVPLPVTALLPVVLFPLLGVLATDEACYPYLQETNMLFIGSLIMAMAIEHCNVHKRIALRVMLCVGTNPRWWVR
ncbi:hypothetical protein HPB48_005857 [Haemaphysalis longicornis]|uniref:Uncharacterized protein n=1 Tax=Haemaphysalis longicornis TaxID=44386 RepID=A0A9J6GDZ2_HAELO|nr:hypothetical protein HPB48_005857 [Haemaphysalis longicornis]